MKVLHLPYNIANWASINVKALNQIEGITAKGVIFQKPNKYHSNDNLLFFPGGNPFLTFRNLIVFIYYSIWADVIHWYWDDKILPKGWALWLVKVFNKKHFIEWLGDEIRIPEIEAKNNSFYKEYLKELQGNFPNLQKNNSLKLQKRFCDAGFIPIICPDMGTYLDKNLFKRWYELRQRIFIDKRLDKPNNPSFTISHNPSRIGIKGTKYVKKAISSLKSKGYEFTFNLINGKTHLESIKSIASSDLFIDQFVIGAHGMATLEALSLGVPTVCYISEFNKKLYPKDLPIISAKPNELEEILEKILKGEYDLEKISNDSIEYVRKYHDASKLALNMVDIYNNR